MVYSVGGFSIVTIILLFVAYVTIHIVIGHTFKKAEKRFNKSKKEEDEKAMKALKFSFNWFPAAYLIFVLIIFYA